MWIIIVVAVSSIVGNFLQFATLREVKDALKAYQKSAMKNR